VFFADGFNEIAHATTCVWWAFIFIKLDYFNIGYLGPDDEDILAAVEQVTGVYKFAHLNPFSLTDGSNANHHSLKVKVRKSHEYNSFLAF